RCAASSRNSQPEGGKVDKPARGIRGSGLPAVSIEGRRMPSRTMPVSSVVTNTKVCNTNDPEKTPFRLGLRRGAAGLRGSLVPRNMDVEGAPGGFSHQIEGRGGRPLSCPIER
ncbi:hypothetical protein CH063_06578, partial [Colletotrichum higginsianum]